MSSMTPIVSGLEAAGSGAERAVAGIVLARTARASTEVSGLSRTAWKAISRLKAPISSRTLPMGSDATASMTL